jgi:TolA-binding protein
VAKEDNGGRGLREHAIAFMMILVGALMLFNLQGRLGSMDGRVSTLDSKLDGLESEAAQVEFLREQLAELRDEVARLKVEVQDLQAIRDELLAAIDDLLSQEGNDGASGMRSFSRQSLSVFFSRLLQPSPAVLVRDASSG